MLSDTGGLWCACWGMGVSVSDHGGQQCGEEGHLVEALNAEMAGGGGHTDGDDVDRGVSAVARTDSIGWDYDVRRDERVLLEVDAVLLQPQHSVAVPLPPVVAVVASRLSPRRAGDDAELRHHRLTDGEGDVVCLPMLHLTQLLHLHHLLV